MVGFGAEKNDFHGKNDLVRLQRWGERNKKSIYRIFPVNAFLGDEQLFIHAVHFRV